MTFKEDLSALVRDMLYEGLSPNYEIDSFGYDDATRRVVEAIDSLGGEFSDGYHTFRELYRYRLLYNAALFNEWAKAGLYDVHKSMFHHDGAVPFGDRKWFIVVAELPTGQISNHYRVPDWDLFDVPTKPLANTYDGHTPAEVADRLARFLATQDGERNFSDSTLVAWASSYARGES
jgi:hypothetical protein